MSEKDGPPDSVSLPPTYAPSEAYTESPPPAYRGGERGSKVVQIVKLVCVTAVVLTLLSGFFILSSNYMKTRACTCDSRPLDKEEARTALLQAGLFLPPPEAHALTGEQEMKEMNGNSLDAGDDTVLGDDVPTDEQVETLIEEVVEAEQRLEEEMIQVEEEEEAALEDILSAQADHMKKIRLPVDLILGNPELAGKEVNCEVERRQIPIAPGVLSQTILVTCRDDSKDDNNPNNPNSNQPGPRNNLPRPPLSLLAPLMKMLSQAGPQPRLIPMSRGPIPMLSQPRHMMQTLPMRNPFNMPHSKPRMTPMRGPIAIAMPQNQGPSNRMLPRHMQPVVRLIPRVLTGPRDDSGPLSLVGLQRGALPLPQARSRAPPSPVSLSPFPPRGVGLPPFLPMNFMGDAKLMPATHMEMNQAPKSFNNNNKNHHQQSVNKQPRVEFGPPKGHTLISDSRPNARPNTRLIALPKGITVHTLPREFNPRSPMDLPVSLARFMQNPKEFTPRAHMDVRNPAFLPRFMQKPREFNPHGPMNLPNPGSPPRFMQKPREFNPHAPINMPNSDSPPPFMQKPREFNPHTPMNMPNSDSPPPFMQKPREFNPHGPMNLPNPVSPPRFMQKPLEFPPRAPMDLPHPVSPPRFASEPRRSPVPPTIEADAEVVTHPQTSPQSDGPQEPSRKHHLLMVN